MNVTARDKIQQNSLRNYVYDLFPANAHVQIKIYLKFYHSIKSHMLKYCSVVVDI